MTKPFAGVWPALFTPFTPEGKPALPVVEKLTDLMVREGLDGLYVVGSTGQWPLLSFADRCAVAERIVKAAAGRIPVIVHVGSHTTAGAVALAKHAKSIGADGVSAVTPIYYSYSADDVFAHYRAIGAAADLPFYIYHLSSVHNLTLAPDDYAQRILKLPNIAGMKITDRDLFTFGLIHAHAGDRLRLFSGADEVMCQAVLSGAIGAIGTFYNLWGPACRRARQAVVAGSIETGRDFMLRFQKAIARVISSSGIWTFFRAAMKMKYNIDIGMPPAPNGVSDKPWPDGEVQRLIALVDG